MDTPTETERLNAKVRKNTEQQSYLPEVTIPNRFRNPRKPCGLGTLSHVVRGKVETIVSIIRDSTTYTIQMHKGAVPERMRARAMPSNEAWAPVPRKVW